MEGGASLLRAGRQAALGPLGCGGFHRILVSGTLTANFSGLTPAPGNEDRIHLSRKDLAFRCLVTTLVSHQEASQPRLACLSSDGGLSTSGAAMLPVGVGPSP